MSTGVRIVDSRFDGGEVSDFSQGLIGSELYQSTLRKQENWISLKQGGAEKRSGLRLAGQTWAAANGSADIYSRLIPFKTVDGWVALEISAADGGRNRVRVWRRDGAWHNGTTWVYGYAGTEYTFLMPAANLTLYNAPDYELDETAVSQIWFYSREGEEDTLVLTHETAAPVEIVYDHGSGIFSAAYAVFAGNGWIQSDLDQTGRNDLGDTPDLSRADLTGGGEFVENPGGYVGKWSILTDSEGGIVKVVLTGTNPNVVRPEWVGLWARCRISGTATPDTDTSYVKITEYLSDTQFQALVEINNSGFANGNTYAVDLDFFPPVLGSLVDLDILDSVSPFTDNDLGLSYMIDYGSFLVGDVGSTTNADVTCVRQQLNGKLGFDGFRDGLDSVVVPRYFRTWARPAFGYNDTDTYDGAVQTGWPRCGVYYRQRNWLAGSIFEKQGYWASRIGRDYNFAPGPDDAEAFQDKLATDVPHEVVGVCSGSALFMLTDQGIFINNNQTITPASHGFRQGSSLGSARVQPVLIGEFYIYVQAGQKALRAFRYKDTLDQLEVRDVTQYSTQIMDSGVRQLAGRYDYRPAVYGVRNDGTLVCGAVMTEEGRPAFSRITTWDEIGVTQAHVESACVIYDEGLALVFCVISRNGTKTVEIMDFVDPELTTSSLPTASAMAYLDSSLDLWSIVNRMGGTVTGTMTGCDITGLDNLAGLTVKAMIGGAEYRGIEVDESGDCSITLPYYGSTITLTGAGATRTVTFGQTGYASEDLVGVPFVVDGGFGIFTVYGDETTMTAYFITQPSGDGPMRWFPLEDFIIGLPFPASLVPQRPEVRMQDGASAGREKRVAELWVRLVETAELQVRPYVGTGRLVQLPIRRNTAAGTGPEPVSGDQQVSAVSGFTVDGGYELYSESGYYAGVSMVTARVEISSD